MKIYLILRDEPEFYLTQFHPSKSIKWKEISKRSIIIYRKFIYGNICSLSKLEQWSSESPMPIKKTGKGQGTGQI